MTHTQDTQDTTRSEDRAITEDDAKRIIGDLTPYQLATLADCANPEASDSPGAKWLKLIRDDVAEIFWHNDGITRDDLDDLRDEISERADQLTSIYTHNLWQIFVDLAAYQEDPSELGFDSTEDMTRLAGVCLYMIADRLISALLQEIADTLEDEEAE